MLYKLLRLKNSTIFKGGLFSIFSFFNKGLNFILLIVIAKYLAPDDYGYLSLYTTLVTLLGFFICLGSEGYMAVAYFRSSIDEFKKVVSTLLCIPFFVAIVLCIVVFVISFYSTSFLDVPILYAFGAIIYVFLNVFVNICLDYFRIQEKIIKYGIYSCSYATLNFFITLIFIISFNSGWPGRIYSMILCAAVYYIIAYCIFFKNKLISFKSISKEVFCSIIRWGVPIIPHHASAWIKQGCDRYIINAHYTTYEVGIFSFALNLTNIMNMIGVAFNASNSVDIYKSLSNQSFSLDKMRTYVKRMLVFYIVVLGLIAICASLIVPALLPKYVSSLIYFYILLPCSYLQCVYFLYCNFLFYYGKNIQIMFITFGTSILHLTFSLIFTSFSLIYTALIYSITQLVVILLIRFIVSKQLRVSVPEYKSSWIL